MNDREKVLYIGGFALPDKNAAAQRVIGISKGLRELGYDVIFLNSLKDCMQSGVVEKEYFGFKCYEYKRESDNDYLFSGKTSLRMIADVRPSIVIAYNYPAFALNRIISFCRRKGIRCFADATEWYGATGKNLFSRLIKWIDTNYRMKYVHKKTDGIIAISRYLYNYYKKSQNTVMIPPTVDISDKKWELSGTNNQKCTSFVYAGSPGTSKERLDIIINGTRLVEKEHSIRVNIVGITREQFTELYNWSQDIPESVSFWGRVDHKEALNFVKQSSWSIILRTNNRVIQAGFPTKLVESISCGTPVIANPFSNVFDYLTESNSICVKEMNDIAKYMVLACDKECTIDKAVFDYHNYLSELECLLQNKQRKVNGKNNAK